MAASLDKDGGGGYRVDPNTADRRGQWAMTVNGPWRLCFHFRDGDAWDVEIVDYH